jgi:serine/threonine-protein kinase RsbW
LEAAIVSKEFQIKFNSDLVQIKIVLKEVLYFLNENLTSLTSEDHHDLHLIYIELLCNAVIHGNNHNCDKYVQVDIVINDNIVTSNISDEGSGFDYELHLSNLDNSKNTYIESGRGIQLVKFLADSLAFYDNGRKINFKKKCGNYEKNIIGR